jgi:osmotically-inducible protein OsmY
MNDASIKSSGIVVSSFKGTVQLSGFADSTSQTYKAVAVAKDIPGVKSVMNDIRVK